MEEWLKNKKWRNIIYAFLICILLNFVHRIALMGFLVIGIAIILQIINFFTKNDILLVLHLPTGNLLDNQENIEYEKDNNIGLPAQDDELLGNETVDFNHKSNRYYKILNYFKQRIWLLGIVLFYLTSFLAQYILFGDGSWRSSDIDIYCYIITFTNSTFIYNLIQPLVDFWFRFYFSNNLCNHFIYTKI